jgi:hypothetical protein
MGATRRTWVDSLLQIPQRRPMAARYSAVVRMCRYPPGELWYPPCAASELGRMLIRGATSFSVGDLRRIRRT